jgi:ABC-type tungstate transport system permease subunit
MLIRLLIAVILTLAGPGLAFSQSNVVILSTTTSTQDSGLLDVIVPMFEKKSGLTVKTISVGTGQALALAARGEADVTLAHAPSVEKKYVDEGKMRNRRLVMYNDFVIIGPEDDPAKIKGLSAPDALKRIDGDFAVALFDEQTGTLWLGRDRVGVRHPVGARTPRRERG